MSSTTFGTADPKTQKKWSGEVALDSRVKSYWEGRYIGTSDNSIAQRKTELESDSGDRVSFDLCVQMRNQPTFGDDRLEGKEESLKYYTDEVVIDQIRHGASAGGKMTRKRVAHDLRMTAKERLGDYFARLTDELMFMYIAGSRGINQDFILPVGYQGHATNLFQAPDVDHQMYGGAATSKATLTAADKMTKAIVERALNKAEMMQARNPDAANMVAVQNGSEGQYVLLMNPDQAYDLRNADTTGWLEIAKAAATNEGRSSPIFKGGLGMIGGAVLQSHRSVVRFNDYGATGDVNAARASLLGRQAAVVAYGTAGGLRYSWSEETKDHGNEPVVASGFIGGMKKTRFNGKDFGVLSIDTAAKDPNAG
jgi:N4-gp56 family major capsid protein